MSTLNEDTFSQLKKLLTEMMTLIDKSNPIPVLVLVNSKDLFKFDSNFEQLIKNGADVNITNEYGSTPLHYAKTTEQTKLLLEAGANPNTKNNFGETPLHFHQTKEQLKLLIDAGANINIQNNYGETRLFYSLNTTIEDFKELLKIPNLDLTLKSNQGLTAKEHLLKCENLKFVKLIEEYEYEKLKEENEQLKFLINEKLNEKLNEINEKLKEEKINI